MEWLLAGLIAPFFRLLVLTPILWLVRRFAPSWEKVLFQKIPNE
jgi:hypothetical protein